MPFWGIRCEPDTKYDHSAKSNFKISSAVLDTVSEQDEDAEGDINRIIIKSAGQNITICNLSLKHNVLQVPLNLSFYKGDNMKIINEGRFHVHLSGYTFNEESKQTEVCNGEDALVNGDVKTKASDKGGKIKDEKLDLETKSEPKLSKKERKRKAKEMNGDLMVVKDSNKKKNGVEINLKDLLEKSVDIEDEEDDVEYTIEDVEEEESEEEDESGEEEEEEDSDEDDSDEEMEEEEERTASGNGDVTLDKMEEKENVDDEDDDIFIESPPKKKRQMSPPSSAGRTPMIRSNKKAAKQQEESPDLPKPSRKQQKKQKKILNSSSGSSGSVQSTAEAADKSSEKEESVEGTPQSKSVKGTPQSKSVKGTPQSKSVKGTPQSKSVKGTPQSKSKKKIHKGGLVCEDIKIGTGAEAKPGKMIHVYYEGRLKSGKLFDKVKEGSGFAFKLGGGNVIQAWDIGVEGMKVGGKRKIMVPPAMGYGKKGAPPQIPPNSFLEFEIELKSVG